VCIVGSSDTKYHILFAMYLLTMRCEITDDGNKLILYLCLTLRNYLTR
jgi:hypothetical protein